MFSPLREIVTISLAPLSSRRALAVADAPPEPSTNTFLPFSGYSACSSNAKAVAERRIGAKKAGMLKLSEQSADIDGGLILRFGRVELNCSLSTVLQDLRREMEGRIAAILFPQKDNKGETL